MVVMDLGRDRHLCVQGRPEIAGAELLVCGSDWPVQGGYRRDPDRGNEPVRQTAQGTNPLETTDSSRERQQPPERSMHHAQATRPPNVIVILVDDMGYGDFGTFGDGSSQTPNLDRLITEGLCFTQHYSASPVCAPARAALLTGRYPHRTGAIDTLEGRGLDRLALNEVTIADLFASSGYATGLIGKWHLGALDTRYHPNARGFEEFVGFRGGWSDYYQWRLDYNGTLRSTDGRYLTDVFTDRAISFLRRHQHEPFFLHVAYNAPHTPLQAPEEDVQPFAETGRFTSALSTLYGMIRRLDTNLGRFLEELDRLALQDDTIVLFTSDNGPQFSGEGDQSIRRFNAGYRGHKGLVFAGGIRVPAVIRWPSLPEPGRQVTDFVHFTDWLPTLLDLAELGVRPPHPVDGRSVAPLLRRDGELERPVRFWQWNRYTPLVTVNAAMREGPWKLVRPAIREAMQVSAEDLQMDQRLKYPPETISDIMQGPEPHRTVLAPEPPLLFNVDDDPFEERDLAATQPERISSMLHALEQWFEQVEHERRRIGP